MLFYDVAFRVEPVEGTVWPNSVMEVTCIFQPKSIGDFQKTMFCEITGRESRLPVSLKAEGRGPVARFSYDLLDTEEVFINTVHRYDVLFSTIFDIYLFLVGYTRKCWRY